MSRLEEYLKKYEGHNKSEVRQMAPWIKILDENVEISRKQTPYIVIIHSPIRNDLLKIDQWAQINDIGLVNDIIDTVTGHAFRFSDVEIATMFKLTFGGEFIDDSVQEG